MTKRELLARIEALEARLTLLEALPQPQIIPTAPWWGPGNPPWIPTAVPWWDQVTTGSSTNPLPKDVVVWN